MADLFAFGFFGMSGPDSMSTPDHPIPDWQSTPQSDPLGDFMLDMGPRNQCPDAAESRKFRIDSATGERSGPFRTSKDF